MTNMVKILRATLHLKINNETGKLIQEEHYDIIIARLVKLDNIWCYFMAAVAQKSGFLDKKVASSIGNTWKDIQCVR